MDNFVVSARKYRPSTFANVVAQSHVTTTLKNAIKTQKLAQAFLFCGPRGVGKTTCARILAKTINCEHITQDIEACNQCTSCKNFNNNSAFNIYELDAASNNSVEDIRSLVEQVRYAPAVGNHKIYIIDEVHMLSNAAFNAFLKTLEEPPSYALFILATTEKHKIIPTILSRCQIFDFKPIPPAAIQQQLKYIAEKQGIAYETEALRRISQKADGALRDALSIFDLIVTFSENKKLAYKDTLQHLHILDDDYYFKLTQALLEKNITEILLIYDTILKAGFDGRHFMVGLGAHFRNLLVCKNAPTLSLIEASDHLQHRYQAHAQHTDVSFLLAALNLANQCDMHYKNSKNQRLHVELALINMAHTYPIADTQAIAKVAAPTTKQPLTQVPAVTVAKQPQTIAQNILQEKKKFTRQIDNNTTDKVIHTDTPPIPQNSTWPTTTKIPKIDDLKKNVHDQKKSPQAATKTPAKSIHSQPFTKAALMQQWHSYLEKLKTDHKQVDYNILNQDIALEGTTIVLNIANPVQQDIVENCKGHLLTHLREALQHSAIDLKMVMLTTEKTNKPYTPKEKFAYLTKKYPNLLIFQKKLDLLVDF